MTRHILREVASPSGTGRDYCGREIHARYVKRMGLKPGATYGLGQACLKCERNHLRAKRAPLEPA